MSTSLTGRFLASTEQVLGRTFSVVLESVRLFAFKPAVSSSRVALSAPIRLLNFESYDFSAPLLFQVNLMGFLPPSQVIQFSGQPQTTVTSRILQ